MLKVSPIEARLKKAGFKRIAGIDEVGRGSLAGPVVSAIVILKNGAKLPGLDDSKKLTSQKRDKLFEMILDNAVDYSITLVPHETIDKINILNSVRIANDICVRALHDEPDIILIDGKDKQIIDLPFKTIIRGDTKVRCIAAASILAKVVRDKVMRYYAKEYGKYGFEKHVGYGTREHRSNIAKHGYCDIHRKSYILRGIV
ncbi:MAG: ribonuclease HII [Candidatus Gracilibacteria bacterium]|jgi:ribonuclease HII